jgi:hypothetical protein
MQSFIDVSEIFLRRSSIIRQREGNISLVHNLRVTDDPLLCLARPLRPLRQVPRVGVVPSHLQQPVLVLNMLKRSGMFEEGPQPICQLPTRRMPSPFRRNLLAIRMDMQRIISRSLRLHDPLREPLNLHLNALEHTSHSSTSLITKGTGPSKTGGLDGMCLQRFSMNSSLAGLEYCSE